MYGDVDEATRETSDGPRYEKKKSKTIRRQLGTEELANSLTGNGAVSWVG
jgi:hypothetical protein